MFTAYRPKQVTWNWLVVSGKKDGSVGVVHGVGYEDGTISVSFCGEQERWAGSSSHLEKAKKLAVGQKTRVKLAVKQPRFGWSGHSHGSVGTIAAIDGDGIHTSRL